MASISSPDYQNHPISPQSSHVQSQYHHDTNPAAFVSDKHDNQESNGFNTPTGSPRRSLLEFFLDWAIKVFGIVAAILFGIWAPISYQAADKSNKSNDETQGKLLDEIKSSNSKASSISSRLDDLNHRFEAIGQLSLIDFCLNRPTAVPCSAVLDAAPITSLISYLANPTVSTSATNSARPSSTGDALQSQSGAGNLSLGASLGIGAGVLVIIGFVIGYLVWRYKKKRGTIG